MMTRHMAAAALLISVFVAGGAAGFAFERVVGDHPGRMDGRHPLRRPPFDEGRRPDGGFGGPRDVAGNLAERLELTEEQRARIVEIMERRQAESAAFFEDIRPRLQAQLDSANAEIRAILTPEQVERFDRYLDEGRSLFSRRFGPPPGGMGPPGAGPRERRPFRSR